jgi:hypothetical protein
MECVAFPQVTAQAIFAAGVTGAAGENLRRCAPDRANGPGPTCTFPLHLAANACFAAATVC